MALQNRYNGNRAAQIAETYYLARVLKKDVFTYSTHHIFSASLWHDVRDGEGKALIDCSAYVGLCLRGIPYEKSPYAKHPGPNAQWDPWGELPSMYGTEGWEFPELDFQAEGRYNNIGIPGRSTLRFAADFADYFCRNGCVVYDSQTDPTAVESLVGRLRPGDFLFWSRSTAREKQKVRFRSISHVAIVAEQTDHFYEVTRGDDVVLYSRFAEKCGELILICRP